MEDLWGLSNKELSAFWDMGPTSAFSYSGVDLDLDLGKWEQNVAYAGSSPALLTSVGFQSSPPLSGSFQRGSGTGCMLGDDTVIPMTDRSMDPDSTLFYSSLHSKSIDFRPRLLRGTAKWVASYFAWKQQGYPLHRLAPAAKMFLSPFLFPSIDTWPVSLVECGHCAVVHLHSCTVAG